MTVLNAGIRKFAALLSLGAALSLTAPDAAACGGFFCSATPVDQTAERIIFSVNPNDTVSAYVQIQYAGERDAFAWIVPVPSEPELDVFPQLAFNAIDLATQPQFYSNQCFFADAAGNGGPVPGAAQEDSEPPTVTVIKREEVGPFETVTLQGDTAEVLIEWLQNNGYRITSKMEPFIQEYVDDNMMFLAMKLLPDAEVSDIEPIAMTYAGSEPMIPIRLTTVAAQPEMGIKAWVFGSRRFAPKNYQDLAIDDASIHIDPFTGRNNYLTVVSRSVDQVGGQAFVTEFAQSTANLLTQFENQNVPNDPDSIAANEALLALMREHPYLTRLYTRMSAEEMNADPYFMPAANQADVSNIHDLSDESQDCSDPPPPPPCAFTYCGRQGVCVQTLDGEEGCACAAGDGSTARPTTTGLTSSGQVSGTIDVYCEPMDFNLSDEMEDVLSTACDGFECGDHGECVLMNGNPTCRCEAGYAATAEMTFDAGTGTTQLSMACHEVDGVVPELPLLPRIGETEITIGDMETDNGPVGSTPGSSNNSATQGSSSSGSSGCQMGGPARGADVGVLALLGLALLGRRRRSR